MGYILTAFAVDLGKVSDAVGSRNTQLISTLVEKFADEFRRFDETTANHRDDEDDEEVLTMQNAITQMVMGERYNDKLGFTYGYALEFLCRHFGQFLPNREWSAMPSGSRWAETVDRELQAVGLPQDVLRVQWHLMYRGAPIAIPEPDDFPGIGFLKLKEIRDAHKAIEKANLASIQDTAVLASIQEVHGWLQTCVDSVCDLVCFYA